MILFRDASSNSRLGSRLPSRWRCCSHFGREVRKGWRARMPRKQRKGRKGMKHRMAWKGRKGRKGA